MTRFVLDCSAAMSLLAESQSTEASKNFATQIPGGILCPQIFAVEVRHSVVKLERRGLLIPGIADELLAHLESQIQVVSEMERPILSRAFALAREERLGVYDAVYLDLVIRENAGLISRDTALIQAAQRRGLTIVDLR